MPRTARVALAAGAVFIAFAVWILSGVSTGRTLQVVDDLVLTVLALTAAISTALAARAAHGRLRASWAALSLGFVAFALDELIRNRFGEEE